jgi:hypothetical protein
MPARTSDKLPARVFVDTSILPRNPGAPGQAFEVLSALVGAGLVHVSISEIAVREWQSQLGSQFKQHVEEWDRQTRALLGHAWAKYLKLPFTPQTLGADCKELADAAVRVAREQSEKLLKSIGADTVGIGATDGKDVVDAYFAGAAPFREVKFRSDFPDAFILCSLKNALADCGPLHFVCGDKALSTAAAALSGVAVYQSLKAFHESKIGQKAQSELRLAQQWPSRRKEAIEFLRNHETLLHDQIESLAIDALAGETVHHDEIPDDNNDATVSSVGGVDALHFSWKRFKEIGPGWIEVPISYTTEVEVFFSVFRGDAFDVPEWASVDIGDFEEEVFFDASGELPIKVATSLVVKFNDGDICSPEIKMPSSFELGEIDKLKVLL